MGLVIMTTFAVSRLDFIVFVFIAMRFEWTSYSIYKSKCTGVIVPTCSLRPFNMSIVDESSRISAHLVLISNSGVITPNQFLRVDLSPTILVPIAVWPPHNDRRDVHSSLPQMYSTSTMGLQVPSISFDPPS